MASTSSAAILPPVSATTASRTPDAGVAERGRFINSASEQIGTMRSSQHEAVVVLDGADAIRCQLHGLGHGIHRNAEHLAACFDDHDAQHRDVKGQIQAHGGAVPDTADERDAAADPLDGMRTTSMPTPRPEMSETSSAVEKPAAKIRSTN